MSIWPPSLGPGSGPKFRRIADVIAAAIRSGDLKPGARLPSHRNLAYQLAVSVGSVAKAYDDLAARDLVRGRVGHGTVVSEHSGEDWLGLRRDLDVVDLRLVTAPPIEDPTLEEAVGRRTLTTLGTQWPLLELGQFPPEAGAGRHRQAAASWLAERGVPCAEENVIFTVGAQQGLLATLATIARRGDPVLAEEMTFASLKDLASMLGLALHPVKADYHGADPDDLERQARKWSARVAVLQPNLQIPTAAMMAGPRRRAIAEAARRHDMTIIDHDGWSGVAECREEPLAAMAPERVVCIEAFANGFMPGLRVGILRAPEALLPRILRTHHAAVLTTPPLTAEVATHWIVSGLAHELCRHAGRINARRQGLARTRFGTYASLGHNGSPFMWLPIADGRNAGDIVREAELAGVRILPAERFIVSPFRAPQAVRVALASARSDGQLEHALSVLAFILGKDA